MNDDKGKKMLRKAAAQLLATALIAAIPMGAAPALAQANDPVAEATALQAGGKADEAYRLLKPLEGQRAGDPAFDYALGVAAADTGRPGEALIALQRVLAVQPNNAPARAELARVYALMGDVDTARAEFDTVVGDPTVPDPVRQRFTRLVRGFDRQIAGGATEVSGFVDFEGGYDSNINAATDETSIVLPVFAFLGPATLNGAAVERGEAFYQAQAGVSVSTPVGRTTRVFGSVLGSYRDNLRSSFVDQGSIVGSAGVAHTLGNKDVISFAAQGQHLLLDGNGYRTSLGLLARYTMQLRDKSALAFSGEYFRLDYDGNPLADAERFGANIAWTGRTLFVGAGGGREQTRRPAFDHLSFIFASIQAGGEFPVAEKVAVVGGLGAEYRNHDSADPLFLRGREDLRLDASLGLRVLLTDRLSVRPRVTYTRNESNLSLYDYDRWTASAGLRFEF